MDVGWSLSCVFVLSVVEVDYFTPKRSLVRSQYRPRRSEARFEIFEAGLSRESQRKVSRSGHCVPSSSQSIACRMRSWLSVRRV